MKIIKIITKSGVITKTRYINLDNIAFVDVVGVDNGNEDYDSDSTLVHLCFNAPANYDIKLAKDSEVITDRYNSERKTTGWYEGDAKSTDYFVVVGYDFFKKEIEPYLLSKMSN